MIKKIILILTLGLFLGCTFESPTQFSEEALNQQFRTQINSSTIFKEILDKHKGKKILVDIWASWCADCVKGFPKIKEFQKKFPEIVTIFISVDKNNSAWKKAIFKFQLVGEHYNLPKGMKNGAFVDFMRVSWIPRYVVIDEYGKIQLFKATSASDKRILDALQNNL